MADLATDNFPVDGGLGANWATVAGSGNPTIRSGVVEPFDLSAGCRAVYTGIDWPADQYAYLTLVTLNTSTLRSAWIILRGSAAALTDYEFTVNGPFGATAQLRIRRFNAGVPTVLGDTGATETVAASDVLRADVVGSGGTATVRLYINGNLRLSAVDTSAINSGSAGIGVQSTSGVTADAQLDNFGGGLIPLITGLGQKHMGFNYARPYL